MNKNKVASEKKNAAKIALIKSLVKQDLASLAAGSAASCGHWGWCK